MESERGVVGGRGSCGMEAGSTAEDEDNNVGADATAASGIVVESLSSCGSSSSCPTSLIFPLSPSTTLEASISIPYLQTEFNRSAIARASASFARSATARLELLSDADEVRGLVDGVASFFPA